MQILRNANITEYKYYGILTGTYRQKEWSFHDPWLIPADTIPVPRQLLDGFVTTNCTWLMICLSRSSDALPARGRPGFAACSWGICLDLIWLQNFESFWLHHHYNITKRSKGVAMTILAFFYFLLIPTIQRRMHDLSKHLRVLTDAGNTYSNF